MQKLSDAVFSSSSGLAVGGATISVTKADGSAASLYSDNGSTPISSTLTADPSGEYSFYAPNGRYTRTISRTAFTTESVTDFVLYDPNEGDLVRAEFYPSLQEALNTGKKVRLERGRNYTISSTLTLPSGSGLVANWDATLTAAAGLNNHVIRIQDAADDVEISGVIINGAKATNTGGNGIAMGGTGGANIRIRGNYIYDCSAHGVFTAGTTTRGIHVAQNYVTGCVNGGITADDTTVKFRYADNYCWLNGTHGLGILGIAQHGAIDGNVTWDNGQGTPNADNLTGYNVSNLNILVANNISVGGLNNGIHFGGSRISYTNNKVYQAAKNGILHSPSSGANTGVVMTGNEVYGCTLQGIRLVDTNKGAVSANRCEGNGTDGIGLYNCTKLSLTGNEVDSNTGDGIVNDVASARLTITGNTIVDNGGDGLDMTNVTLSTIGANTITGNTGYGINVGGTEAQNVINGNTVRGNTAGQIAQPATSTRVSNNETGVSRTLASAATLTLPPGGEYFYITGTTGITSITTSFAERRVTLQFDDVLTVTDGSNLRLAGNFSTTFMDTITLICDGTNWVECSRSVN